MDKAKELKATLTQQNIGYVAEHQQSLESAKSDAMNFVRTTNGISVLSDFSRNCCHTYSGTFGQNVFALPEYLLDRSTPFEDCLFNCIRKDDMLERHILELRFFRFLKTIPLPERMNYQMSCIIHLVRPDGSELPILHSSRYIQWQPNGAVWLGLCTYLPLPIVPAMGEGGIIDLQTGSIVKEENYVRNDCKILSRRQAEILALLAKGNGSKQIAEKLSISIHTVNRHRQDILTALNVSNSASAVEIGLRLRLI